MSYCWSCRSSRCNGLREEICQWMRLLLQDKLRADAWYLTFMALLKFFRIYLQI